MRPSHLAIAFLLLLPTLSAQSAPYQGHVSSVISNVAPSEGLWYTDRLGTSTPILGLIGAGSAGNGVSCVRMDPIDGRLWLGGTNNGGNTAGQVNWVRVSGSSVSAFAQHATIGFATAIGAMEFDDNGNPIVVGGTSSTGGIFRVDRKNGGLSTLIGVVGGGTHNAITKDGAGNLYVGMFGTGEVHQLLKNVDGSFQSPQLFGTVPSSSIVGITFVPAVGAQPEQLWIVTGGVAGSNVFRMPLLSGSVATVVPTTQPSLNWIEYDKRFDDVLYLQTGPTDRIQAVDRATGAESQVAVFGSGVVGAPTSTDSNDDPDNQIVIAPMRLNGSTGPFDLEFGVTAPPGTIVALAVVSPALVVVGVGVTGPDGRYSVAFPNVSLLGALPPAALAFSSATLGPSGIGIGNTVFWPAN